MGTARLQQQLDTFDGIICLGGEDWWYHNRGHFDFQIMRRLAQHWPVLFVNSLGVRFPKLSDSSQFVARISRKLKSLGQGLIEAEPNFWVFSPFSIPGSFGQQISNLALRPQIRRAASRAGINNPLVWVHCPAGAELVSDLNPVRTILQRTDRFETFPEGDSRVLGRQIAAMKRTADLVIYAAPHLETEERGSVARSLLVTHGVDLERFADAGLSAAEPPDAAVLPRPRVGFIGGIDAHTFDPELFLTVAATMPDVHFMLVGGCSLPEGWCQLSNVSLLGRKPYDEVAGYMAASDVLIMPWNKSPWIEACNPVKLKEYLAVGRPIVTRNFAALESWRDAVRVADTPEAFIAAIRASLADASPHSAGQRLTGETWDAKARIVIDGIASLGATYAPARPARASALK